MGRDTGIQWCDSTVNPTTGCDGCELWELLLAKASIDREKRPLRSCYAGGQHEGRLARAMPRLYAPEFTEVRLAPGRMAKAAAWPDLRGVPRPGKPWIPPEMPRLVFVGDMGDVFSTAVPFDYLKAELLDVADSKAGRRHVWMVLTKRPSRFAELASVAGGLPENVWAGTSITGRASLRRAHQLRWIPAGRRFLSVEPLTEEVDLRPYFGVVRRPDPAAPKPITRDGFGASPPMVEHRATELIIVGGESDQPGHRARPFDLGWARSIRDQCEAAGVPFFLKQLGSNPVFGPPLDGFDPPRSGEAGNGWSMLRDSHGGDWSEWPEDLRVRQMPAVAQRTFFDDGGD